MEFELGQLADLIGGELTDPTQAGVKVSGVRSLDAAGPGDLAFLWDDKYRAAAKTCKASAVIAREAPGARTIPTRSPGPVPWRSSPLASRSARSSN